MISKQIEFNTDTRPFFFVSVFSLGLVLVSNPKFLGLISILIRSSLGHVLVHWCGLGYNTLGNVGEVISI